MGWALASFRPVPLQASAGDRSGESIVATGPVLVRFDEAANLIGRNLLCEVADGRSVESAIGADGD